MGTSRTPLEMANKLAKAAFAVERAGRVGVRRSAAAITASIRDEIVAVAPSGRLSGAGRRGARVGASFTILPGGESAVVKATGPLHLIERDTSAHTIPSASRRRTRKRLRLADGSVRNVVVHPGTKGRHPFAKGEAKGVALSRRVFARGVQEELAKVFR